MTTIIDPDTSSSSAVTIADPQVARGRFGVAVRHHGLHSDEARRARQNLIEANIAAAIRREIAAGHVEGVDLRREQVARLMAVVEQSH